MTVTDDGVLAHEFVQSSLSELHRFAQSRLKRYDVPSGRLDADDVVQYTFAEMLERWNEIKNPRQYMFTVARRRVLRAVYEGQRFSPERPIHDDGEIPGNPVGSPASWLAARPADQAAFERIMAGDLYAALQSLTPQQRRAVTLIELGDLSRATVAAEMAVTTGAVSAHRDRGLKRLRRQGGALLTATGVFASILMPHARGRWGEFTSADGAGTSWADALSNEVTRHAGPLVGLVAALIVLSTAVWMIKTRVRFGFGGSPKRDEVNDPQYTIETIAHDLRRLDQQRRAGVSQESPHWSDAVHRAFDERLRMACRHFGVTEYLQSLDGMDREIERLRVEGALEAAGLTLR